MEYKLVFSLIKKKNNTLENNWIIPTVKKKNVRLGIQEFNFNSTKFIRKRLISGLKILNKNKNMLKPQQHLNSTSHSIRSLKYLLSHTLNHFYTKIDLTQKKHKSSPLNTILFNHVNRFFTGERYVRKESSSPSRSLNLNKFYKNSLLVKKPGYIRCFSKINRSRCFVSFKKFKKLFFSSPSYNSIFFCNNFHPYVLFSCSNFATTHNFTNILTFSNWVRYSTINNCVVGGSTLSTPSSSLQDFAYSIFSGLNTNAYDLIHFLQHHIISHKLTPISIPAMLAYKTDNSYSLDTSNLSLLWSGFYNTLFLSKTNNMSSRSLFMSTGYSDQKHFLKMKTLFADIKFGNFYLNYFTTSTSTNAHLHGLLSLSTKFNSSFFNFLKWRKSITNQNTNNRMCLLTTLYEGDFKNLISNCYYSRFSDLRCMYSSLHYFTGKKSLKTAPTPRSYKYQNDLLNCFRRLQISFKKPTFRTKSHSFNSRPISKIRHSQISKEFSYFGDLEFSTQSTYLRNTKHRESFYPSVHGSNYSNELVETRLLFAYPNFNLNKTFEMLTFVTNPSGLKLLLNNCSLQSCNNSTIRHLGALMDSLFIKIFSKLNSKHSVNYFINNLVPNQHFNFSIFKNVSGSHSEGVFTMSSIPWHYNSIIRFMEFCSGKKVLFQFYPFLFQSVEKYYVVTYKRWMTRMVYYERKLGHRFFLEEALHLIHLTLNLHDPKIMCTWLKAIIERISFWKTRSIFRFIRYVFGQYFHLILNDIGSKGLKICLRGKISAAGNSRTRTILYRTGQTSHSNSSLKVLNEFMTITTFTGVMGFQIWVFY